MKSLVLGFLWLSMGYDHYRFTLCQQLLTLPCTSDQDRVASLQTHTPDSTPKTKKWELIVQYALVAPTYSLFLIAHQSFFILLIVIDEPPRLIDVFNPFIRKDERPSTLVIFHPPEQLHQVLDRRFRAPSVAHDHFDLAVFALFHLHHGGVDGVLDH